MALFRKEQTIEKPASFAPPRPEPAPDPTLEPPLKLMPQPKPEPQAIVVDGITIPPQEPDAPDAPRQRGSISEGRAALLRLQMQLADALRKSMAPDISLDLPLERTPERDQFVRQRLQQALQSGQVRIPPAIKPQQFFDAVMNEIFGYGPIEPLVQVDGLTEIMVNGPYIVYIEQDGKLTETGIKFLDDDHVERIVKRIVLPLGRLAERDNPLIDARLPDGSRVNAVIRPCAIDGPNITIRKFAKEKLTIDDLLSFGSLSENMIQFLEAAVVARRNIIVSGGTGSGKTTLINALSGFIPDGERVVTIEDAAELQLKQRHVVRLETKKATPESPTEITIRQCVINALRMRPERIIVGECRGGEALDMLQAMNTGHDGSMTTIHANAPRECISRLETLVLMAGVDLPVLIVRKQIASSIHLIVQAARLRDGSRKITHITEVLGMEGDNVVMQDIFTFEDWGDAPDNKIEGAHEATGIRPQCDAALKQYKFNLPPAIFMKNQPVFK
jgi:pilus assembly protein CpaF